MNLSFGKAGMGEVVMTLKRALLYIRGTSIGGRYVILFSCTVVHLYHMQCVGVHP